MNESYAKEKIWKTELDTEMHKDFHVMKENSRSPLSPTAVHHNAYKIGFNVK